jgi:hypothetical protein
MTYPYSSIDLLENPEKYQFTKFQGKEFLEFNFCARKTILKNISSKIEQEMNFTDIVEKITNFKNLENDGYDLEELLGKTLKNYKNLDKKSNEIIDIFVKKYEIKKRLSVQYDSNFKEKDSNFKKIRNYFLLDLLCIVRFNETQNLKFLNVILKINDMLGTQISFIVNKIDLSIFKWILENEIKIVMELCKLKGVKI